MEKIKKEAEEMEREEKRKAAEAEKAQKEAQRLAAVKGALQLLPLFGILPSPHSYGPVNMPRRPSTKFVEIKAQSRRFSRG